MNSWQFTYCELQSYFITLLSYKAISPRKLGTKYLKKNGAKAIQALAWKFFIQTHSFGRYQFISFLTVFSSKKIINIRLRHKTATQKTKD